MAVQNDSVKSPSEWYLNSSGGKKERVEGRVKAYNSVPREGNVFKSIGTRGHVLGIEDLGLRKVVLADATRAVEGEHVSGQAAVDDAFAAQTRHVSDTRKRRAVSTNGRVRREGEHTAATLAPRKSFVSSRNNVKRERRARALTAFEIASGVHALP